jgi:predicted phosphodiesterase
LKKVAPVIAVSGNIEQRPGVSAWASALPTSAVVEAGAATIYVLHDIHKLDLDPGAAGFQIVVSGHSHQPSRVQRDGILYLNPGSAGPGRFRLPISVARLDLARMPWRVDFIDLS